MATVSDPLTHSSAQGRRLLRRAGDRRPGTEPPELTMDPRGGIVAAPVEQDVVRSAIYP